MPENTNNERGGPLRRTAANIVLLALPILALTAGCRSSKTSVSNRMASIVVTNQPLEKIEGAIQVVFKSHTYEETKGEEDELVFQKPGSFMNSMIYGDWYSGGVWERIKIYQRELDPARTVVECDGYMVQEHDDPMFQKEKRQYNTKKGHLQKLLEEVAGELKTPTDKASPPRSQ